MPKRIRDYGLTLALLGLFVFSLAGQFFFGFSAYNEELREKGLAPLAGRWEYATSGHFVSSVGENWESEFLQMGCFVLLTVFLI